MKRFYSVFLALAMFWSLCYSPLAFASAPAVNASDRELSFATITLGDETMIIPVIVETSKQQMRITRSGGTYQDAVQTATYYIPATEEGIAYNNNYVQAARFTGTSTDQEPDPKHYFTMTSTISFTLYDSLDGKNKDSLLGLNKASITRSQEPIGIGWDILGVSTLTIDVVQVGMTDRGHGTITGNGTYTSNQVKTYQNVSWGNTGVNVPSDWYPVMIRNYGTTGYDCSARYTMLFYYSDGNKECVFTHHVVK